MNNVYVDIVLVAGIILAVHGLYAQVEQVIRQRKKERDQYRNWYYWGHT